MTVSPRVAEEIDTLVAAHPERAWLVPRTIGIGGKIGHGKSTLARMIQAKFEHLELAFADHLRNVCEILLGLPPECMSDPALKAAPLVGFDNGHVFPFDARNPVALNLQIDKALGVAYCVGADVFTDAGAVQPIKYRAVRQTFVVGPRDMAPHGVRRAIQMRFLQHIWMPLRNGKVFSPREILQLVGTEIFRAVDPTIWAWAWTQQAEGHDVVAPDVRFSNEVNAIRERQGVCIHVSRPGHSALSNHVSELSLDTANFDFILINDGDLEDLWLALVGILDKYSRTRTAQGTENYLKAMTA